MMSIIHHPTVPLVTSILGGVMQPGQIILIQCEPLHHCNRFCVNLVSQSSMQCVFHFDFRFDQNTTVRNCNYNSGWGHEERSPLTVHKGRTFYMEIRCTHDRFMVAIDGHHHSEFMHRVSSSFANALQIQGDVRVHMVEFKNSSYPPSIYPPNPGPIYPPPSPYPSHRFDVYNPPLPFTASIGGPLMIGNEIQVIGRVAPHPNRFSINLQQGHQPVTALHFNPRFEGGHRVIVLNSRTHSGWAHEEKVDGHRNPFYPNGAFQMRILRQPHHFEVHVNGAHVANFNHRLAPEIADTVYIEGDVIVDRVFVV